MKYLALYLRAHNTANSALAADRHKENFKTYAVGFLGGDVFGSFKITLYCMKQIKTIILNNRPHTLFQHCCDMLGRAFDKDEFSPDDMKLVESVRLGGLTTILKQ